MTRGTLPIRNLLGCQRRHCLIVRALQTSFTLNKRRDKGGNQQSKDSEDSKALGRKRTYFFLHRRFLKPFSAFEEHPSSSLFSRVVLHSAREREKGRSSTCERITLYHLQHHTHLQLNLRWHDPVCLSGFPSCVSASKDSSSCIFPSASESLSDGSEYSL